MNKKRLGFAMCGSFCTHRQVLDTLTELADTYDIVPILSEICTRADTRFGKAAELREELKRVTGREPITDVVGAEPIGPKALLDVLLVAPCTGNTAAKLAAGITDGPVTMAAKAHLRNGRPVVLALASNDGLSAGARNIGELLVRKGYYFVPFGQDDPQKKPTSLVADFSQTAAAVAAALEGRQIQPILVERK